MAERSARRQMLEERLADDPTDQFLRYGLALQCLREGDVAEGRERLRALIADHPAEPGTVAAWQQLGQSHMDADEAEEARAAFGSGIALARAVGDPHAAAEMGGMLEQLG